MSSGPHDALFKAVFGESQHAGDMLRSVMPRVAVEALEWHTLVRQPGSFVDPVMRERHTDLLFSAAWRGQGVGDALVYLLFEHQSTDDPTMAYRLLRYKIRIWERWWAEHPDAKAVPAIVAVVLYHGATPWSAPRSFGALLDVPRGVRPELDPYLVQFTYVVEDLSKTSDDELHAGVMSGLAKLALMCLKHARRRADFLEILGNWADVLRDVARAPGGKEALALAMRYILLVSDHVEPEALQALLDREIGLEAKDSIMTAGQRFIEQGVQQGIQQGVQQGIQQGVQQGIQQGVQQGIQQGIQQGVQQGIQQGVQQGERALLLRLLRKRFGHHIDASTERRITEATAAQLDTWTERLLSAATLTELLAD